MSDPTPVKISELTQATVINDTDEFVIVQNSNSRRVAQSVAFAGGSMVGDYIFRGGNVEAISASHPRFCLTNFENSTSVDVANYPDYVPWLRAIQIIYLEGLGGQTNSFSGSVSGSVLTLDDNTANNALFAALTEDQAAFGTFTNWRTIDIDGVTFPMSALTAPRAITVTGSPSTGTQNATFYPHRIAGSTTTARLISLIGRTPVGAGTGGVISGGLLRRDQMQQITGRVSLFPYSSGSSRPAFEGEGALNNGVGGGTDATRIATDSAAVRDTNDILFDSANSPNARAGTDTHPADFGSHIYQFVGRYVP